MTRGERLGDAAAGDGGPDQAARARRDADRLLLQMTRRGGHWAALLAFTSIAGAAADTLLPAAAGHTVDVMLRAAQPGAAASQAARWLACCIALIGVVVICDAAGEFATGMSTAAATEWLRHKLAGHLFACGLRLPRRFPVGDLVSRMTGGAADASFAAASAVPAAAAVIPPAGSIVALGLIDPWLALAFAAGLPRSWSRCARSSATRPTSTSATSRPRARSRPGCSKRWPARARSPRRAPATRKRPGS